MQRIPLLKKCKKQKQQVQKNYNKNNNQNTESHKTTKKRNLCQTNIHKYNEATIYTTSEGAKGVKSSPPVRARLYSYQYDPRRRHTRAQAVLQLMIQELKYVNHINNPVTGARETYNSLFKQDSEKWGRSFVNELGILA